MSIHSSLCPHAHCAMYFWDMMWVNVRADAAGTIAGLARKAAFSAAVICVGVWPASLFLAFTKSIWEEIPFVYAVRASARSPARYAASALMNWSCEYVMAGIFALSSNR